MQENACDIKDIYIFFVLKSIHKTFPLIVLSVESQKGTIDIQRHSVENQKDAITVQGLW